MELPIKTIPYPAHLQTQYQINIQNLSYKISPKYCGWFEWKGLDNSDTTKCILNNVSCEAKPGELTAIAGPSGAGKTTLLEILAGAIVPSRVSGQVLVNDLPMNVAHFHRVSGFVSQDEALFPLLTVEEVLTYSARLRLQAGPNNVLDVVQNLLKELGLEHIASARIGCESHRGISGGEKRRVSIGVELVHNPAVLLLDEPTSGLDSASALHVMLILKSMAKNQGKTIVVTIHQPGFRIIDLFDKVILLSKGVVLHNGSIHLLEERINGSGYCIPRHVNVLEYAIDMIEILHKQNDSIETKPEANYILNHGEEESSNIFYSNSPFIEVLILIQRFSNNVFRTKELFAAKTIQSLLAGIVLGTIFIHSFGNNKKMKLQNQIGFLAFTLTFLMSSTTEALPIFLQERRIMMRETSRGVYRVSSYVIANTLVFFPFLLVIALLYAIPVYWLVGLRRDVDGFLYFSLIVWMAVLMANSLVACLSALVPNFITGTSLIYGILGSFFLFSGYFLSRDTIPKCWDFMHYLSLFKYPFECFMINEFGGEQGKLRCLEGFGDGGCLIYGNQFLVEQGLKESQKWNNLIVMLCYIFGYRFAGFMILWYRSYRSRR